MSTDPFARKQTEHPLFVALALSVVLVGTVLGAGFVYAPYTSQALSSTHVSVSITKTNTILGAINTGMFKTYTDIGSSVVTAGQLALEAPAMALTAAVGMYKGAPQAKPVVELKAVYIPAGQ